MTIDGWTVTITAEAEADPGQMFYAFPYRNYIFDDDFQVTVNSKHLLSAGKSTANDRTADVIGAVASLIPAVAGLESQGQGNFLPTITAFLFRSGLTTEKFKDAQELLRTRRIVLGRLSQPPFIRELNKKEKDQGLVFRLAEPYTISLTYPAEAGKNDQMLRYSHVFILPGLQPYVLEYHRVAFVKKVQEVGFTDGMLTDYHENLPSPILGVLGIPKAIIGAIVPLVGGGSLGGSGTAPAASPPVATP